MELDDEQTGAAGEGAAGNSDLESVLQSVSAHGLSVRWAARIGEPLSSTVLLRTRSYKADGRKSTGRPTVFRLAAAQSFYWSSPTEHLAQCPASWFSQNIAGDDRSCFVLMVHLEVKSLKCSFVSYHVLSGDRLAGFNRRGSPIVRGDAATTKLLDEVLTTHDAVQRNQRLKLIPRVVEGPYPVKRVVENRPVLLGNKVTMKYFRGANYLEIDAKVDESMVAASIIKLCHRFAKRIVVDMAWTLQGERGSELPERMLCGVTIHHMDFAQCRPQSEAAANCHKLQYQKADRSKNSKMTTSKISKMSTSINPKDVSNGSSSLEMQSQTQMQPPLDGDEHGLSVPSSSGPAAESK